MQNLQLNKWAGLLIRYLVLSFLVIVIMSPVLTAVLGSVRTTGEFITTPFGFPQGEWQWQHYTEILQSSAFWNSMMNSLLITTGVVLLNISLASMLAFAFTRLRFFGRNLIFNILSFGLLFPLTVAILPIFIQIRSMGLIDSLWGVITPLVAFGLPGSTIILRSFFIAIPNELEDASYIDGCTTFGFFRYVLLPMARPALAAVAVIQVIQAWNEYFLPLLVLNEDDLWPLPLGIMQFQGQFGTDWARVMAYVTLLIIPAVVFYIFTEKYIVTGLTGGELKG
jgi:raffinose/stachyose/melibiose transport system permease protein